MSVVIQDQTGMGDLVGRAISTNAGDFVLPFDDYHVSSKANGLSLDGKTGGADCCLWPKYAGEKQRWRIGPAPPTTLGGHRTLALAYAGKDGRYSDATADDGSGKVFTRKYTTNRLNVYAFNWWPERISGNVFVFYDNGGRNLRASRDAPVAVRSDPL